jgi:tRNA-specific 2-thiouridylase
LAFYTIGQRKGLGISSPIPLYVFAKDISRNNLIVGKAEELGGQAFTAGEVNWVSGEPPVVPVHVQLKIRYKAVDAWGVITPLEGGRIYIFLDTPVRDITPGQAVVFYDGDICLGCGIIEI